MNGDSIKKKHLSSITVEWTGWSSEDHQKKTIKRSYLRVVIHRSLSLGISPSLGIYGDSYILQFVLFGESFLQSAFNFRVKYGQIIPETSE